MSTDGGHAGAQLAGGAGAGTTGRLKSSPRRVSQVAAVEHRRREAEEKTDRHFVLVAALEAGGTLRSPRPGRKDSTAVPIPAAPP